MIQFAATPGVIDAVRKSLQRRGCDLYWLTWKMHLARELRLGSSYWIAVEDEINAFFYAAQCTPEFLSDMSRILDLRGDWVASAILADIDERLECRRVSVYGSPGGTFTTTTRFEWAFAEYGMLYRMRHDAPDDFIESEFYRMYRAVRSSAFEALSKEHRLKIDFDRRGFPTFTQAESPSSIATQA